MPSTWPHHALCFLIPVPIVGADSTATCIARALAGRGFQRNSSGKALAPFVRVARGMKYGVDRDRRLRLLVQHGVWKATYQGAAVALVNDRVHLGSAPDAFQTRIDRTQELLTQSGSAAFIPDVGFCNVQLGFRSDHQIHGHSAHAPCASPLPRAAPKPGFSVDSLSCVPVPAFANRGLARPPARPQGRPTDLRQVGASRTGLDQRSTLNSFGSPLPILSNCLATWASNATPVAPRRNPALPRSSLSSIRKLSANGDLIK